jgi:hypothetical protein
MLHPTPHLILLDLVILISEGHSLLDYTAVQLRRSLIFWKNILPPSPWSIQKPSKKPASRRQQAEFPKLCSIANHNNLFIKDNALRTANTIPVAEYML